MKPKLILISHGKMAQETLQSAKMIVGEMADASVISMEDHDGLAGTKEKLYAVLNKNGDVPTVIISDLKGGTPCNVSMMAMGEFTQLRVLSGLNLAMVIEASVSPIESVDELADYLQTIGQEAVVRVEIPEADDDTEEIDE